MAILIERIVSGALQQNGYVVHDGNDNALFIDTGGEPERFAAFVDDRNLKPLAIINTHAHFDHIGAVAPLMTRYGIPFYLDSAEQQILRSANIYKFAFGAKDPVEIPTVTHDLAGARRALVFGDMEVASYATPGHTPGGRSFMINGQLFTGDTLFRINVGRTDLHGGDDEALAASVRQLMALPPDTIFHPGHGQPSTLAEARRSNPHVIRLLNS